MGFGGVLGYGGGFTGANNQDLQGAVTVNGVKPDANGNVQLELDNIVLVDDDPQMAANSDEVIPTQKAVNTRITGTEDYLDNTGYLAYFSDIYQQAKT